MFIEKKGLNNIINVFKKNSVPFKFVGGCVRDRLLKHQINDIDIATPEKPETIKNIFEGENYKLLLYGIDHGTVGVLSDGNKFEITTLRKDKETYGRKAKVEYTNSWLEDAKRRDFTINALFATPNGEIEDFFGGENDIKNRRVKFIGNATERIKEDYLRILRLFRFHGRFGRGNINKEYINVCKQNLSGIDMLSKERIFVEFNLILQIKDLYETLLGMYSSGVLLKVLSLENDLKTHKLSLKMTPEQTRLFLFYTKKEIAIRSILKFWSLDSEIKNSERWYKLFNYSRNFVKPSLSVSGQDIINAGIKEGRDIGEILKRVEEWWITNSFLPNKKEQTKKLEDLIAQHKNFF